MMGLLWSALVVWSRLEGMQEDPEEAVQSLMEREIAGRRIQLDLELEVAKWEVACAEKEFAWMADQGTFRRECRRHREKLRFYESQWERIKEGMTFDIVDITAPERNVRAVTARAWELRVKTGQGPLEFFLDDESHDRTFRLIQCGDRWKIQSSEVPLTLSELPKNRSLPLPQTTPLLKGEVKEAAVSFVAFQQEREWLRARYEIEIRGEALRQSAEVVPAFWDRDAAVQFLRRKENQISLFQKSTTELERFDLEGESIEEEAGRKIYKCTVARKRVVPNGDTDWKLETKTKKYRISLMRICKEWRIVEVN